MISDTNTSGRARASDPPGTTHTTCPHEVTGPPVARITKSPIQDKTTLCEAYEYPSKVAFSRGMRVALDNCVMLFISGTASVDERGASVHAGDFAAQTRRAFLNIARLLASEGADWHDVVRTTCYVADFRDYDRFNDVRNTFFAEQGLDPYPASTCVEARICRPELLVEIDAIAVIPAHRPRPPTPQP